MSVYVENSGDYSATKLYLDRLKSKHFYKSLDRYGEEGVAALAAATPMDSGLTAMSWTYSIEREKDYYRLAWYNHNMAGTVPVAILIQYGHATGNGAWIEGQDFINPALKPIFDEMVRQVAKEVKS